MTPRIAGSSCSKEIKLVVPESQDETITPCRDEGQYAAHLTQHLAIDFLQTDLGLNIFIFCFPSVVRACGICTVNVFTYNMVML